MYTVLGMWHAPLEIFLEFRGMKLLMRPFLAQYDAIQSPDDSFTCMNIYPFHPLHYTAAAHYQRGRPPSNDAKQDTRVRKKWSG